ncbi:LOW QUALITY PROTEIN: sperm-associated microtubule inner protein 4 [Morphnus guianensis]
MMLLHALPHYYREIEGTEILSRTFESNEVLTPLQIPSCPTISQDRYKEFTESLHCCKLPWGAEREHGGIALPVLPEDNRAKGKSPCTFVKGHQTYGSGVDPWPRYSVKCEIRKFSFFLSFFLTTQTNPRLLRLPFPTSHPYQTHISTYAMIPNFRSHDLDTAIDASSHQPFHPHIPTKAFDVVVLRKTRELYMLIVAASVEDTSALRMMNKPDSCEHLVASETNRAINIAANPHKSKMDHLVYLKQNFLPSLSQVRPLEGYTACLLQGQHPYESILQEQYSSKRDVSQEQATLSQTCYQKVHYLDTRPPIYKLQKITDTLQTEALYRGQLSARPELESLPKSACSLSYEDFKPRHLDQHTIWENPVSLNKPGLPLDVKSEESRILLHKLSHQEACQPSWRPEDGPRQTALPEWIPSCKVPLPSCKVPQNQTALLELQHSFCKTAAQKHFHDSIRGETKDLSNITEGKRHKFYGFNAFYFFN